MRTKLLTLATACVLAALAQQAMATQYRDADPWGTSIAGGGSVADSFNISILDGDANAFTVDSSTYGALQLGGATFTSAGGYIAGTPISGGDVSFWFRDASGAGFQITVGLDSVLNSGGSVVFHSDSLDATLIADLQLDGVINYSVQNNGPNSITFDYALLEANVPDGGMTVACLGFAFVGVETLRRKLRA
jgi:hypothetical protein